MCLTIHSCYQIKLELNRKYEHFKFSYSIIFEQSGKHPYMLYKVSDFCLTNIFQNILFAFHLPEKIRRRPDLC